MQLFLDGDREQDHVESQRLHGMAVPVLQDLVEDGHVQVEEASREDGVAQLAVVLAQDLKGLALGVAVATVKLVLQQQGRT